MKICRVYSTLQVDLFYSEHYLAKQFSVKGHSTTFITSDKYLKSWAPFLKDRSPAGYYKYRYFDVFRLRAFFPLEKTIFMNWIYVYRRIFNQGFDIVHIYGLGTFTTYIVVLLSLFSPKPPPILVSDHTDTRTHKRSGTFANLYYALMRTLYSLFKERISAIVVFNKTGQELISKRFQISEPKKFKVIPLGFDAQTFNYQPEQKNTKSKFVIGYAGKVDRKKRVEVLIRAINDCRYKSEIICHIVGVDNHEDPYIIKLCELAENFQLNATFHKLKPASELAKFYNYIDLAVFPGGISVTTIEANACGIPIILYESINDIEHRVEHGRGKIFRKYEELVEFIEYYYLKYRANEISSEDIAAVTEDRVSWDFLSREYLELYETLINLNK